MTRTPRTIRAGFASPTRGTTFHARAMLLRRRTGKLPLRRSRPQTMTAFAISIKENHE